MRTRMLLTLFCLILAGIFILFPQFNYQEFLYQGDHGRDLHAFWATSQGDTPYRDYWWVYGPLMPYFYGLLFKILGVGLPAVLAGRIFLLLCSAIFVFLALSLFIPRLIAFLGALWFLVFMPDFFFTYNHVGGIAGLVAVAYFLLRYIRKRSVDNLYALLAGVFLLCFIKVNFGLAALAVTVVVVPLFDRFAENPTPPGNRKAFLWLALTLVPCAVILAYAFFIRGLPLYVIRQCLPYLSIDHPHHAPVFKTMCLWWEAIALNMNVNWPNRLFALIVIFSGLRTFYVIYRHPERGKENHELLFAILALALFYVACLHEFFVSGIPYRTFWAKPFSLLLLFLFLGSAVKSLSRITTIAFAVMLAILIAFTHINHVHSISLRKTGNQFLPLERARIFVGNTPRWIETVRQATLFLRDNLADDETFFAYPYESMFYFLAAKPSPTRHTIFYKHINITPSQEQGIIDDLERRGVNWVLLSSRVLAEKPDLEAFEGSCCPRILRYITDNFQTAAEWGDWTYPPGWTSPYGVRILKRGPPPTAR